jgi:hypothetical protein
MEALSLVISALQEMKTIYDDISTSNESCRHLAQHCEDLANPVKQIQDNSDLIDTNSAALTSLLALLNDCKSFCKVFNTRSVFEAVTHHNRDKDAFISLHRRLDSAAASFNLQVSLASIFSVLSALSRGEPFLFTVTACGGDACEHGRDRAQGT